MVLIARPSHLAREVTSVTDFAPCRNDNAPVFSVETVMQRIGILFSVVAVFLISCVQGQTRTGNADAQQPSAAHSHFPKVTIANSELWTIKSTSTGRDYDLYIHIPKQYDKDQTAKYPVLYLLDAQWEFMLVEQVVGGLVFDQYMPDLIIVGITYSGENADYDGLRAMDLTPTPTEGIKGSGDGPKFLKFLKTELIPFVEASYRVDPARRVLMGGSLGGLFTLYAMLSDPRLVFRVSCELSGSLVGLAQPSLLQTGSRLRASPQGSARKALRCCRRMGWTEWSGPGVRSHHPVA